MALYWFYRRSPSLLDQIEPFLKAALLDKEASVVFVALELWKKIVAVRWMKKVTGRGGGQLGLLMEL